MFKKNIIILSAIISFSLLLCCKQTTFAQSSSLQNLSASKNNDIDTSPVSVQVTFQLPSGALSIQPTDYIQINLSNFSDVSAPSTISGGYSGTPTYSVDGTTARVTGIGVSTNTAIVIGGISATSPSAAVPSSVIVSVTSDEDGFIIKNTGQTVATYGGSNIIQVSAAIQTPQAGIEINGYTSPNNFITFTEDGTVMGTTISTNLGYFSKIFSGLEPGDRTIVLYGVDSSDLITSPHTVSSYFPAYTTTTVSDILLSPTVKITDTEVLQGDDLVATGSAAPGATVTLFTDTPLRSYIASAAADGSWDYTINNTSSYVVGDYTMYSLAQDSSARQSLISISLGFSVIATSSGSGTACGDLSEGDLNCDNQTNLTDFSILMYYWGENNATADINGDGIVNLTDFSVLMYYWGN